ncbi:3-deoxy-7-phosphoheptulonate synthase [Rhodobacteraceae bacterium]|nr:3-deoxy-7-phosphoheptulonate synthase [Paracoccaceae bacterium]
MTPSQSTLCKVPVPAADPAAGSGAEQPLPAPHDLRAHFMADGPLTASVVAARDRVRAIMSGGDDRLLVIVGPCSIHDPEAALAYAHHLATARQRFGDRLEIVMRCYFEKPRTTVGWKGLLSDPRLDGSDRLAEGLGVARRLLLEIGAMGVPAATEFLDPLLAPYISDLVAWGAIGARTTESQIHRQMVSGLPLPVGFKNGTDGGVQIALDALGAAQGCHVIPAVLDCGRIGMRTTAGNPDGHLVLRGGHMGPNFHAADIAHAAQAARRAGAPCGIMVDASHANSGKDPQRQRDVVADLVSQLHAGAPDLRGLMIESNLVGGRQPLADPRALRYGQSITDGCLGWAETEPMLEDLARAVEARLCGVA